MISEFFSMFQNPTFLKGLEVALGLWPIWLPIACVDAGFRLWISYKQREWIKAQGSLLLEVKLPNEMLKSPALMEVFLQTLHQTSSGGLSDVYLKGSLRPWFSLELVSEGGQVHFYIWMHPKFRKAVETQLYALFPTVEIYEAPDYALPIQYDPAKYKFSKMTNIILSKPDAFPIKTYIDYGLDKDPKEEFKNDPMAPMIEFLGSLNRGEHAWIQIMIQGHTKEGLKYGRIIPKPDWKEGADKEIKEILKKGKFQGEEKSADPKFLSDSQKDAIKAIERSLDKPAFDAMIRAFYFAELEAVNPNNIGGLLGSFKQFSSSGSLNGLKPGGGPGFDYIWQDFKDIRKSENERAFLEAYKRRSFFNRPFKGLGGDKPFILTTEEIATLYHFPSSMVVATPTLSRIPSKKSEAPANLPM